MICRNNVAAQVLCTLLFPDGTWTRQSASTRSAKLSLIKGTRTYASGRQILRAGKINIRLRTSRTLPSGVYRLRITVGKTVRTVNVTIRKAAKAGSRV